MSDFVELSEEGDNTSCSIKVKDVEDFEIFIDLEDEDILVYIDDGAGFKTIYTKPLPKTITTSYVACNELFGKGLTCQFRCVLEKGHKGKHRDKTGKSKIV